VIFAIVVAAGRGLRFGGQKKKQFLSLGAEPLLIHALCAFQKSVLVDEILCVVSKEDCAFTKALLAEYDFPKVTTVLSGGKRRQDSVSAAVFQLEQHAQENDIVLVHDGVRPLLDGAVIERVIEGTKKHGAAVASCELRDSLKLVSEKGGIKKSLPRERIRAMQTPQGFRLGGLAAACRKAFEDGFEASDEAMLLEHLGHPVFCVEGAPENIKITTPSDLKLAAYFLSLREAERGDLLAAAKRPLSRRAS